MQNSPELSSGETNLIFCFPSQPDIFYNFFLNEKKFFFSDQKKRYLLLPRSFTCKQVSPNPWFPKFMQYQSILFNCHVICMQVSRVYPSNFTKVRFWKKIEFSNVILSIIIHKWKWRHEGAVSSTTGLWWSPSEGSRGKPLGKCGLFTSGGQINSLKYKRKSSKYLFWIRVCSLPVLIYYKVKFYEFQNSIRRLIFLCRLPDIINAWINLWGV